MQSRPTNPATGNATSARHDDAPADADRHAPSTPNPRHEPHLTTQQEQHLLDAHRRGDADALGELLRAYQRRIYSICYRMVENHDQAMDLAQDAMVRIIEGLDSFDGRSQLSTWIFRVTMNTALSHLRREKLRRHASLDRPADTDPAGRSHGPPWSDQLADAGAHPAGGNAPGAVPGAGAELSGVERIEQRERHARLAEALRTLEPANRALLILRDMQGLDYARIGEVLELPVGTVKSRLFRARAAVREALDAREQSDPADADTQPSDRTTHQ